MSRYDTANVRAHYGLPTTKREHTGEYEKVEIMGADFYWDRATKEYYNDKWTNITKNVQQEIHSYYKKHLKAPMMKVEGHDETIEAEPRSYMSRGQKIDAPTGTVVGYRNKKGEEVEARAIIKKGGIVKGKPYKKKVLMIGGKKIKPKPKPKY